MKESRERFAAPFFWVMIIIATVWSAPPYISLGKLEIPMPSSFMYNLAPMFRQYGRFGLLAILSVAVLAGIGLKYLLKNISSLVGQYFVTLAVGLLILLEFINIPPFKTIDVSAATTPAAYKWLALQKGDFAIAEYPFLLGTDPRQYDYFFYQRIHKKKMINGAPEFESVARIFSYLGDITHPETPPILRYLGVKYVILHTDLYRSNQEGIPAIPEGQGLIFVRAFPNALVYRVTARPKKILWVRYKNFYPPQTWPDGRLWNWALPNAEVVVVNFTGRVVPADIRFWVTSLGRTRRLRVSLNKKFVKEVDIPPQAKEVILKDVELKPGENSLKFLTQSPPEPVDSFLNNGDTREATFAFSDFSL